MFYGASAVLSGWALCVTAVAGWVGEKPERQLLGQPLRLSMLSLPARRGEREGAVRAGGWTGCGQVEGPVGVAWAVGPSCPTSHGPVSTMSEDT